MRPVGREETKFLSASPSKPLKVLVARALMADYVFTMDPRTKFRFERLLCHPSAQDVPRIYCMCLEPGPMNACKISCFGLWCNVGAFHHQ